jgi:cation diffusion facilitator CzcD-associated flavoprotein CzcO
VGRSRLLAPYGPWQQRLCLVPDGDLFTAIREGRASVVTDTITACEPQGLVLASGTHLPADVIVKATGLKMAVSGGATLSRDGVPVVLSEHFHYKDCMVSNLPNFVQVFGYLNASWTLRVDLVAAFTVQVLTHMARTGTQVVTPVLPANHDLVEDTDPAFSSGYLRRGLGLMPRSSTATLAAQPRLSGRPRLLRARQPRRRCPALRTGPRFFLILPVFMGPGLR